MTASADNNTTTYLRMAELAKILGWPRTNVYYWAKRCDIKIVTIAGHQFIPVGDDLPKIIMTLQQAKAAVAKGKPNEQKL